MGIFKRKEVKPNAVVVQGANMANNVQDALGMALGVEPKPYYQEQPQQVMPQQVQQMPMQQMQPQVMQQPAQQPAPQYYPQQQQAHQQSPEDEIIEKIDLLTEAVSVLDQRLTFIESRSFRRGI